MAIDFRNRSRPIAPLVMLRIAFGAVLCYSTVRFIAHGWVGDFYINPRFHFPFEGFGWLHPAPAAAMYAVYIMMAVAAAMICTGLFYRIASAVFFLLFCYTELLDKTYYLNHYYLVTLFSFLLMIVPANRYYSLDVWRKPSLRATDVPAWTILIFRWQLGIIYCCAGLSKISGDWLLRAMPLKIWLAARSSIPWIGPLLKQPLTAYLFSWGGMLFDLSVVFLLLSGSTRKWAYALVILFHLLTALLFQIGMFPYLMMSATLIFFSDAFHQWWVDYLRSIFRIPARSADHVPVRSLFPAFTSVVLTIYFFLQLLIPFRFVLFPGSLLWTEEGYRFSWRVMLMEKSGTAFFYVHDPRSGRKFEVNNRQYLTAYQERMMETQPDMMLQYARLLATTYRHEGIPDPRVTVESYVSLNGYGSRLFIDSSVNLAAVPDGFFRHKYWIKPFAR